MNVTVIKPYKDFVVMIEFMPNILKETIIEKDIDECVAALKRQGFRIIEGRTVANKMVKNIWFPYNLEPFNCVRIAKACLGIKERQTWTAYKLFKVLTKKYNFKEV